jgi:hypothetical protein
MTSVESFKKKTCINFDKEGAVMTEENCLLLIWTSAWWKLWQLSKIPGTRLTGRKSPTSTSPFLRRRDTNALLVACNPSHRDSNSRHSAFLLLILGISERDGTKNSVNHHLIGWFSMLDLGLSGQHSCAPLPFLVLVVILCAVRRGWGTQGWEGAHSITPLLPHFTNQER